MKKQYTITACLASLMFLSAGSINAQCGPSMVTTLDGDTAVYTCPGDSVSDVILLDNTASMDDMFTYIVTDDQNMILEIPGDVPMIDVEEAGEGICRVWGLTYSGTLTAEMGDDLMNTILATGCAELSDNYISLYRDMPEAGTISIEGGGMMTTVVTGDGMPDVVEFETNTTSISNYAWIITDEDGMILGVEHVPMHDFEPADPGTCLVYGVSYTGMLNAPMGEDVTMIELSDDCYDLSDDHITVVRLAVGILDAPSMQTLHMYPTVVNEILTIEIDRTVPLQGDLQIHDLQGRSVKAIPVLEVDGLIVVNTTALASGHYTCTITTEEGKAVGRFVRE